MTFFRAAKRAVLWQARLLGIQHAVLHSRWRRNRLAILCYHGISIDDDHEWDPRYYVTPAQFESRLRLLQQLGCAVLPLGEAIQRLKQNSLPPKSVAITFDDGCFDFYARAFPLLQKYAFPATVYLTTFYAHCSRPVFALLCRYILAKTRSARSIPIDALGFTADLTTEDSRESAVGRIVSETARRNMRLPEKFDFAADLARSLQVDTEPFLNRRSAQIMHPAEVREVSSAGIAIELHTHRHRTPSDRALFDREIEDNRREIAEMTGGHHATHFCYPSGVYTRAFLPWLEASGVVSATTCDSGLASPADHPLLLPRITDHSRLSEEEFASWITGLRYLAARHPIRGAGAER
jgi:peptidoglycan/xylan/chitin deacetylase (PgdA/CDA1 family)